MTDWQCADFIVYTIGGDIFPRSLTCLAPFARLVVAGLASGQASTFSPQQLLMRNQSVVGYYLIPIVQRSGLTDPALADLMAWCADGQLQIRIGQVRPLAEAAEVHRDLEARRTIGKQILVPGE